MTYFCIEVTALPYITVQQAANIVLHRVFHIRLLCGSTLCTGQELSILDSAGDGTVVYFHRKHFKDAVLSRQKRFRCSQQEVLEELSEDTGKMRWTVCPQRISGRPSSTNCRRSFRPLLCTHGFPVAAPSVLQETAWKYPQGVSSAGISSSHVTTKRSRTH